MLNTLIDQLHRHSYKILALYLPVFLLLVGVVVLNRLVGIPVGDLTRDPTSLGGIAPWSGALSNIGILVWCAAMTLCFAGGALLRRYEADLELSRLLMAFGFLTAFLMLDDFFVLHESFRDYLGFPEKAFFAIYIAWLVGYGAKFWRQILRTDFLLLLLALIFLGASMGLDTFQKIITNLGSIPYGAVYLIEDGLKLFGIVSWFGYFATLFFQALTGPIFDRASRSPVSEDLIQTKGK